MADPRLFWYQLETIDKMVNKLLNINFSDILEVKEARRKLVRGISANIDFHTSICSTLGEFHDCEEFESRTKFGRKMLRIIDETIRELEDEA